VEPENKHKIRHSRIRQLATRLNGKNSNVGYQTKFSVIANLREPIDTLYKLVESTGVKEKKLETILDIGELAEKGKILTAKCDQIKLLYIIKFF
jgi:hypothetical protein